MMDKQISIRHYESDDEHQLFSLLEREGEEWKDYWFGLGKVKYIKALRNSITYLLFENNNLCGYARCRDDDGYGIYIYDLLVDKNHRRNNYGRKLMEQIHKDFQNEIVYVMSDVNGYYEKLGYKMEGSIFIVEPATD